MAFVRDRWHVQQGGKKVRSARYGQGKRWQVCEDGQPAKSFEKKIDADNYRSTLEADQIRGTWIDPRAGKVTLRDYAERWRVVQVHRPSSRTRIETRLRRHVYPALGDRSIGAVRPTEVQAFAGRLVADGLSPSEVTNICRTLGTVFKAAVADRLIAVSPCTGTKIPKASRKQVVPPTLAEVEALTAAVADRHRALVTLAAGTGVRQGEAWGLEVECIDFLRRTLLVRQQLLTLPGEPVMIAPPKSEASCRTIPLPQVVVDALARHLAEYPAVEVRVLDTTAAQPVERLARLLFTTDAGRPHRRNDFSRYVWNPARTAARLTESLTFHGLRHFYASLLIRHNESVKVVQARLGHATAQETLNTYAHLWPDSEDCTREAVDSVMMASRAQGGAYQVRTGGDR